MPGTPSAHSTTRARCLAPRPPTRPPARGAWHRVHALGHPCEVPGTASAHSTRRAWHRPLDHRVACLLVRALDPACLAPPTPTRPHPREVPGTPSAHSTRRAWHRVRPLDHPREVSGTAYAHSTTPVGPVRALDRRAWHCLLEPAGRELDGVPGTAYSNRRPRGAWHRRPLDLACLAPPARPPARGAWHRLRPLEHAVAREDARCRRGGPGARHPATGRRPRPCCRGGPGARHPARDGSPAKTLLPPSSTRCQALRPRRRCLRGRPHARHSARDVADAGHAEAVGVRWQVGLWRGDGSTHPPSWSPLRGPIPPLGPHFGVSGAHSAGSRRAR